MRWPWSRETRSQPVTDALVAAVQAAAAGRTSTVQATAAAEVAAGLWSRAFAAGRPEPSNARTEALTPSVLGMIGRSLVLDGEAVFEIATGPVGVQLLPASGWSVHGDGPDPASWSYEVTASGPSGSRLRRLPASRVVHVRYAVRPTEPWRGISPLATQSETAGMLAALDGSLRREAASSTGRLIPVPERDTGDLDALKGRLSALDGGTLLVPSTATAWGDQPGVAPRSDWVSRRLGVDPPAPVVDLRDRASRAVLVACGVPPALTSRSDGTALRESWRQFLFGVVAPVSRLVVEECAVKLDAPSLTLEFDDLRASDLTGRARAFKGLVESGMPPDEAAALAGFD